MPEKRYKCCPECKGRKRVFRKVSKIPRLDWYIEVKCPRCRGKGWV